MKRILEILLVVGIIYGIFRYLPLPLYGSYIFRNSATNINTGTLPNARVDSSSVTKQGNTSCAGCSGTYASAQVTVNNAGIITAISAGVTASVIGTTSTLVIGFGGELYFATASAIPVSGAYFNIGRTTFNVMAVKGYTNIPSTVTATMYRLALSSATGGNNPNYNYMTQQIVVGTGTHYSNWVSTSFAILADEFVSVHITTTHPANAGGNLPAEGGTLIEGWWGQN